MAEDDELSLSKEIAIFSEATKKLFGFATEIVLPQFVTVAKLYGDNIPKRDAALFLLYYRQYYWMRTFSELNDIKHFQAVTSGARSMFEMMIDILLLHRQLIEWDIDKFYFYPESLKYRHVLKKKQAGASFSEKEIEYLNTSNRDEIEATIIKYWGTRKEGKPNIPSHWSGMNLYDRCLKIQTEQHIRTYDKLHSLMSNVVHTGPFGFLNVPVRGFELLFLNAHLTAQQSFIESTRVLAKVNRLNDAIDWFEKTLKEIEVSPAIKLLSLE